MMRMNVRLVMFVVACLGAMAGREALAETPLRLLFVGNSYTFYNHMPDIVRQMSLDARQSRPLDVHDITVGGSNLEQHWQRGAVQKALADEHWDYVVIQDHSMGPVDHPELTRKYVRMIAEMARQAGAQPILYLTWARQNNPAMQARLDEVYTPLANELHALLAPVGQAWKLALQDSPQPVLFDPDGSHPSYTGSYLAASVFYSLIYGSQPPSPGEQIASQFRQASAGELQKDAWSSVQAMDVALRTQPRRFDNLAQGSGSLLPAIADPIQVQAKR